VYAVKLADYRRLPGASYQMRRRRVWSYSDQNILRVRIRDKDQVRELVHTGEEAKDWTIAPGSQGVIEPLAVGETVRLLGQLTATNWVARGTPQLARYGFTSPGRELSLEMKNGDKATLQISYPVSNQAIYGAVALDEDLWI